MIALPGADDEVAQEVANRIAQNVYNITLSFERKTTRITVYVGTAIYPDSGDSAPEMLVFADRAMNRDKHFRKRTDILSDNAVEGRRQAGILK